MEKKILVIDDDPMIRTLVEAMLVSEGFSVTLAEDGEKGIEVVDKQPDPKDISLIICDVVMPGMNGLDVVTRLKLHTETESIPILMLTGEDKAEDIMAGYSVGADYYITKPFTRQQLLFGLEIVLNGWEN
ncbi:response regulator transcription factor [Oligoflexia bacterium]|nr:response regulator transcription factor [Oligoflexia bacterium]